MSNHHLRNKELSLKAKGLLSQMLSLPEDWDYTLAGLSHINREKIDAIREAVKELEKAGYIVRSRERDEKGRLRGADYVIYEQPQPREPEAATSGEQPPISDYPMFCALSLLFPRPALGRVKNTIDVLFDNAVFLHLLFRLAVILIQFAFPVV